MNKKIKIVYVITSTGVGGAEKILYHTIRGIDDNKYTVLLCTLKKKGVISKELEKHGVSVHCLKLSEKEGLAGWFSSIMVLFRLFLYLREQRPTIIHSFLFRANILTRIAGCLTGVPVIISSTRVMGGEKGYYHLIERVTSFMVDRYIAVSGSVKRYIIQKSKVHDGKVSIIYNGVKVKNNSTSSMQNMKMYFGIEDEDNIIITVGRLHKQKGYSYLFHAISMVEKEMPRLKLLIIGEGEDENNLKDLAESLDLNNKIIFAGLRYDVEKILPMTKIFILPSLWEGMPNVLLEAMAAGKPVIATEVGGVPEVVLHGKTGILVPPEDSDAIANAMRYLLQDELKAKKMGEAGRLRVEEHFTIAGMLERTEDLYQELLKEKRLL